MNQIKTILSIWFLPKTSLEAIDANPTAEQFYSQTERVSETTKIRKWMGDIYVGVTNYIKPIDVFN